MNFNLKKFIIKFLFLCLTFLSFSCVKKMVHELDEYGTVNIKVPGLKIKQVEEIPWKVGVTKKVEVSKGIRVEVELPAPTGELANILMKDYGADSWIIQLGNINNRGNLNTLGSIMQPFPTGSSFGSKISLTSFYLNYGAVMPSKRFQRFDCPAFGHNKRIENIELEQIMPDPPSYVLLPKSPDGRYMRYQQKQEIGSPIEFNIGSSLRGRYRLKVALYNSQDQTLVSTLVLLQKEIHIPNEEEILIPGCADFVIPENKMQGVDKSRTFKFKNN